MVKVVQTGVLLQWHFHAEFIYPVATAVIVLIFWEDLFEVHAHTHTVLRMRECVDEHIHMYVCYAVSDNALTLVFIAVVWTTTFTQRERDRQQFTHKYLQM